MKTGRNDPCPCGSGKKYKNCCLGKGRAVPAPPAGPGKLLRSTAPPRPLPRAPRLPAARPKPPPRPRDPAVERWNARWHEFEARDNEGRRAVFLETLDDPE